LGDRASQLGKPLRTGVAESVIGVLFKGPPSLIDLHAQVPSKPLVCHHHQHPTHAPLRRQYELAKLVGRGLNRWSFAGLSCPVRDKDTNVTIRNRTVGPLERAGHPWGGVYAMRERNAADTRYDQCDQQKAESSPLRLHVDWYVWRINRVSGRFDDSCHDDCVCGLDADIEPARSDDFRARRGANAAQHDHDEPNGCGLSARSRPVLTCLARLTIVLVLPVRTSPRSPHAANARRLTLAAYQDRGPGSPWPSSFRRCTSSR